MACRQPTLPLRDASAAVVHTKRKREEKMNQMKDVDDRREAKRRQEGSSMCQASIGCGTRRSQCFRLYKSHFAVQSFFLRIEPSRSLGHTVLPLPRSRCLRCFSACAWAAGTASGRNCENSSSRSGWSWKSSATCAYTWLMDFCSFWYVCRISRKALYTSIWLAKRFYKAGEINLRMRVDGQSCG